ncbi:sugar transferase [Nocardioides sp. SYSU D00038]|uniref:sugar transferase n=1 Tax=Nocardioides sp. SYSU D00038 TaxID=2812554 RepID=UPI0019683294|nr:sugar transferase [Nocardioides sp. SYSU D00038]
MKLKRAFDLVLVTLAAVAWVPTLLVSMLAVLVFAGRPVFYRSMRRVSPGRTIRLVKFRTMVKNAAELVNRSTVPVDDNVRFLNIPPDSPLYTKVGRALERCGVTELPQLLHVVRGEMSLIGNRPLPENVIECLVEEYPYAEGRFLTKAGLTGPTQLVGRAALTDEERLQLEISYCKGSLRDYSLLLDFEILLLTVLIAIGIKRPLTHAEVLAKVEKRTGGAPLDVVLAPPAGGPRIEVATEPIVIAEPAPVVEVPEVTHVTEIAPSLHVPSGVAGAPQAAGQSG